MSEKDTGTPRTDTFYDSRLSDMKSEKDHETSSAWYSFARTLERELANVKAQLAAAEARAKRYEYVMNMSYLEMVSLYTFPLGDRVAEIDRRMILEATRNMESGEVKIKAESRAEKADAKVRELFGTEKGEEPTEYGRKVEDPQDGKPSHYQVAWVFRHIRNHFLHGGTYRYLIYDRMGFNETAYTCMYEAGGMLISNTAYDLAEAITRAATAEAKVVQLAENIEKLERQLADKTRELLAEKLAHKDAKEDVETFRREVCGLHEQLTTTRAKLEQARELLNAAEVELRDELKDIGGPRTRFFRIDSMQESDKTLREADR